MRWDDPSIAGFARQAGWAGGDVALATAIALAASGGDDAYEDAPLWGAGQHYVGLWGVDITANPQYDASLMRNPVYSAEAAHTLWLASGRRWDWSPVYRSGAYRHFAAEAAFATTQASPSQSGFALGGDDLDPSGLAHLADDGHTAINGLSTVVKGL
jgi:Lysozyme like domain